MAFDHRGNSGDSFRETVGEDITDLDLRVRFAGTIIGIAPVYPSEYPPPPLRVQRIVLMNEIENITFLFHPDEYKRINNQWGGREELFERERCGDPKFRGDRCVRVCASNSGV